MKITKIENIILIILYIGILHTSAYAGMVEKFVLYFRDMRIDYASLRNIFMLILILFLLGRRGVVPRLFSNRYGNLWYLFSVVVMISVFPSNVGQGIKLLMVPVVYFMVLQYDDNILENMAVAATFNGLWILLQSLNVNRVFIGVFYSGIYENPNTFGASMVVLFVASFCVSLLAKQKWIKVLFMLFCAIGFYYILLSYCRTALLGAIVVLFVTFFVYLKDFLRTKKRFIPFFILLLSGIVYVIFQYQSIIESVFSHIYKWGSESSDLSSSRLRMWRNVLLNPTLLGTNPSFMPHNNFLAVFYQHGVIAGMLFVGLIVYIIVKYYGYYRKQGARQSLVALLFILMFVCVGMFEESLGFTGREWLCLGYVGLGYAVKEMRKSV